MCVQKKTPLFDFLFKLSTRVPSSQVSGGYFSNSERSEECLILLLFFFSNSHPVRVLFSPLNRIFSRAYRRLLLFYITPYIAAQVVILFFFLRFVFIFTPCTVGLGTYTHEYTTKRVQRASLKSNRDLLKTRTAHCVLYI